jgi:hypothetical protein
LARAPRPGRGWRATTLRTVLREGCRPAVLTVRLQCDMRMCERGDAVLAQKRRVHLAIAKEGLDHVWQGCAPARSINDDLIVPHALPSRLIRGQPLQFDANVCPAPRASLVHTFVPRQVWSVSTRTGAATATSRVSCLPTEDPGNVRTKDDACRRTIEERIVQGLAACLLRCEYERARHLGRTRTVQRGRPLLLSAGFPSIKDVDQNPRVGQTSIGTPGCRIWRASESSVQCSSG